MSPCREWTGYILDSGYGQTTYRGRKWRVHRLAWTMKHGEIPKDKIVMHKCDNKKCYRLSHLRLGTCAENSADMCAKGRQYSGPRKWSWKAAYAIYMNGFGDVKEIANMFNVCGSTVVRGFTKMNTTGLSLRSARKRALGCQLS